MSERNEKLLKMLYKEALDEDNSVYHRVMAARVFLQSSNDTTWNKESAESIDKLIRAIELPKIEG